MTKMSRKSSMSSKRVSIDIFLNGCCSLWSKPCMTLLMGLIWAVVSSTYKSTYRKIMLTTDPLSTITRVTGFFRRFPRWTRIVISKLVYFSFIWEWNVHQACYPISLTHFTLVALKVREWLDLRTSVSSWAVPVYIEFALGTQHFKMFSSFLATPLSRMTLKGAVPPSS